MGKLKLAQKNMLAALDKLHEAIDNLAAIRAMEGKRASLFMDNDELQEALRDSLIQRFEFCVDLFWKYLKKYEVDELGLTLEVHAPRPIVMTACKANVITESDGERLLEMIESRNLTSHIYKEEIADRISMKVPEYYTIMKRYVEAIQIK